MLTDVEQFLANEIKEENIEEDTKEENIDDNDDDEENNIFKRIKRNQFTLETESIETQSENEKLIPSDDT
jgi:hypothetical protein